VSEHLRDAFYGYSFGQHKGDTGMSSAMGGQIFINAAEGCYFLQIAVHGLAGGYGEKGIVGIISIVIVFLILDILIVILVLRLVFLYNLFCG